MARLVAGGHHCRATIVVGVFNLAATAGVSVVGPLPQGLPSFQIPWVAPGDLGPLLTGAIALTLVSFADTSVLSRTFALRGGYHDITRYPEARRIPGLVLFRWDAPLFFANAEIFREHVLQSAADAPTPTAWIVVAAEPVTDVDITAAEMLSALDDDLAKARASRLPLLGDASGCMVGLGGGAMIPAPKCDLRAGRHYRL